MFDQIEQMQERIDDLEDALMRIKQWCQAYPVSMFHEVDDEELQRAGKVLMDAGIMIDNLHASWARHLLDGIGEIASLPFKRKGG